MAQKNDPFRQGLSMATRIGVELVVSTVAGGAIGFFLDRWIGTKPWFMIVGILFGAAAGFRSVYRIASTLDAKQEKKEDEKYKR